MQNVPHLVQRFVKKWYQIPRPFSGFLMHGLVWKVQHGQHAQNNQNNQNHFTEPFKNLKKRKPCLNIWNASSGIILYHDMFWWFIMLIQNLQCLVSTLFQDHCREVLQVSNPRSITPTLRFCCTKIGGYQVGFARKPKGTGQRTFSPSQQLEFQGQQLTRRPLAELVAKCTFAALGRIRQRWQAKSQPTSFTTCHN